MGSEMCIRDRLMDLLHVRLLEVASLLNLRLKLLPSRIHLRLKKVPSRHLIASEG